MWRLTLRSLGSHRRRLLATSLAVVLGVAFLTGSLALAASLDRGHAEAVAAATTGIDALVRSDIEVGVGENSERGLVDRSLADTIAAVDGVAAVAPWIETNGRIIGADGDPVDSDSTVAGNWVDDDRLNLYELAAGRAPAEPGEVVIDRAAAKEGELSIGDTTTVRVPEPIDVTIVGLVTFGGADSRGSATYAGFTTEFTDTFLNRPATASGIAVGAEAGVDQAELVGRLDAALPGRFDVITGDELAREMKRTIQGDASFQQAVLVFAGVALVVAAFNIQNTLSIIFAQRTRELALLRTLGASRGQILGSVTAEAFIVGLVGGAGGITAGLGLAASMRAIMDRLGQSVPPTQPTLDLTIVVTGLVVGVGVTTAAAIIPALRASRVAPLAALREVAVDHSASSRLRAVTGALLTLGAVTSTVLGAASEDLVISGVGSLATLTGVVVLGPVVARPAASGLGRSLASWGMSGTLARHNARRNPRRTAATSTSLMIGTAVVVLFTVVAASLTKSIDNAVAEQFAGELVIIGEGRGGLSTDLAAAVEQLPEVAAASPIGGAAVRIDGRNTLASTFDPATIQSVVDVDVRQGSLRHLRPDQVAVSGDYASQHNLAIGDGVTVDFADGATERATVGAVYDSAFLITSGGIFLPRSAVIPHTSRWVDVNMLIDLADGVTIADGEVAVQNVANRYGAPDVQTNQEFTDAIANEVDLLLTTVYALLVIAIVIALMGIANALSLSVHERTRELGLLRAVGQTRSQSRATVRGEALIVSLYGTTLGVGLGLFLGWTLTRGMSGELAADSFTIPAIQLLVVLVIGASTGVLAAAGPARRAARLDVLEAIATE